MIAGTFRRCEPDDLWLSPTTAERGVAGAVRHPDGEAEMSGIARGLSADRFAVERELTQSARTWLSQSNVGQAPRKRFIGYPRQASAVMM